MKEHEDRDGCNKTATKPSNSERISVLPSAIDDLIQVVERGNVEEIKDVSRQGGGVDEEARDPRPATGGGGGGSHGRGR